MVVEFSGQFAVWIRIIDYFLFLETCVPANTKTTAKITQGNCSLQNN